MRPQPKTASEFRQLADSRGFTASPLVTDLLNALDHAEKGARSATSLRKVAVGGCICALVLAAASITFYSRLGQAETAVKELTSSIAAEREQAARHRKDLDGAGSALDKANKEAASTYSTLIEQLKEENKRLKSEIEKLRSSVVAPTSGTAKP